MASDIFYPSVEQITEYNLLILEILKVKKSDTAKVLSYQKLNEVIKECTEKEGDIYDKAVILLSGLVRKHPFASGNRRTAFIVTKDFLWKNHIKLSIKDDPQNARIMLGIREGYYTIEEIKEWIRYGKIKPFNR